MISWRSPGGHSQPARAPWLLPWGCLRARPGRNPAWGGCGKGSAGGTRRGCCFGGAHTPCDGVTRVGKNSSFPKTLGWVGSSQHPARLPQAQRSEVSAFRPILSSDLDKSEHLITLKMSSSGALPPRPSYPPRPPVVNAFVGIISIKLINRTRGFPRAGHTPVLL